MAAMALAKHYTIERKIAILSYLLKSYPQWRSAKTGILCRISRTTTTTTTTTTMYHIEHSSVSRTTLTKDVMIEQ